MIWMTVVLGKVRSHNLRGVAHSYAFLCFFCEALAESEVIQH